MQNKNKTNATKSRSQSILREKERAREAYHSSSSRHLSLALLLCCSLTSFVFYTRELFCFPLSLSASSNCILSSSVLFCYCFLVSLPPSHSLFLSTSFSALSSILLLIIFVHCTLSPCLYLLPFFLARKKK